MTRIVSEKYDSSGNVVGYDTDDGQMLSVDSAREMIRKGEVAGAITGVNENGERVIHIVNSDTDGKTVNPMNNFRENEWMVYSKKTIF